MKTDRITDGAPDVSRRFFLSASVATGGGLLLAAVLPSWAQDRGVQDTPPQPNLFLRIAPDSTVTVQVKHLDMGQGTATGLVTLVAEELDADWAQMRYEFAPAEVSKYRNGLLGVQGTGVSTSMANSWTELRKAGAAARSMLIAAAAQAWSVPDSEVKAELGKLSHAGSGRSATYGDMAARAAALPVPQNVEFKPTSEWRYIGADKPLRLDSAAKASGKETFGLDVRLPGMVFAALARPSKFGATFQSVDDAAARAIPGVLDVVQTKYGVAVVASDTWAAFRGRGALKVRWNEDTAEKRSSPQMFEDLRTLLAKDGPVAKEKGDVASALKAASRTIDAEYSFPYLAHAPLEMLNATVQLVPDGAVLHTGCQFQTVDQAAVAQELGLQLGQVKVVTYMAGGTFGRRANPASDYVREAAAVARAYGKAPVQLVWTRTDDLHGGYYRSMFVHRVRAGLNTAGAPVAWDHRLAGHSIGEGTAFARFVIKNGIDHTSEEGSYENKYELPNFKCTVHAAPKKVPVLWWRSVGHTHGLYVTETMADELAAAARVDPLAWRLKHLPADSRLIPVLKLAAEKAGWGRKLPRGQGLGIAAHSSYGSHMAHVAQVRVAKDGKLRVERVICAVDCGIAVNPDNVRAQAEGGVAFALSALLYQEITFKEGVVEQENFHNYPMLRMDAMPKVEVYIVPSAAPPTGIGEPVIPTVGPAVANALFAATGRRIRTLPFSRAGIVV